MAILHSRAATVVAALALVAIALPRGAQAQAWVPSQGEGSVSVAYQNMNVKKHLAATTRVDGGQIDTQVMLVDFSFGLTDKIAVDFALPLVSSKYTGPVPHPGTDIDNRQYHTSFSDVRFAVRYNLARGSVVFTPYAGSVVPSHDYAFYGHAAPGQRLNEIQVGAYAAKLFEKGVPGLFVSGRYAYGFVEKVIDISHNRSYADLEVGYFFSPRFRAFAMTNGQYSYGGIDFPATGGMRSLPLEQQPVHDQIQRVHYLDVGGGAAYSVTDNFDIFGSFSRLVAGRNGHALNRGITIGGSWSFALKKKVDPTAARKPSAESDGVTASRENSLIRCICQKSGL